MASLFKKISPASARLATLFARQAGGIPFPAGGTAWVYRPVAGADVRGVAGYGKIGDAECTLWLDDPDWRTAAASVLDVSPAAVADLHASLSQAALECFFSDVLVALEKALALPVALSRLEMRESPVPASAFHFRLESNGGLSVAGAWSAAEGAWRGRLEQALGSLAASPRNVPDDMALAGRVAITLPGLSSAEYAGIKKGDVILSPSGAGWILTVGRRCCFAAVITKGLLVADGKTIADAESPVVAARADDEALESIAAAEVDLRVEVGRLTVSLAELRRLAVGEVVEFPSPVDAPAILIAGGRRVATGELVDVGGRVGVRITALSET